MDYNQIFETIKKWNKLEQIKNYNWVAVQRGGVLIAHMLSTLLNKDFGIINPRSNKFIPPSKIDRTKKYLLIDDIIGVGETMINCFYILRILYNIYPVDVFTLIYDPNNKRVKPNFYIVKSKRFIPLPWEPTIFNKKQKEKPLN